MEQTIADKIKYYRKMKNMSQDDLANLSGINVSTIKKYECGFRNTKPDQLLKIANALGVSINYFVQLDIENVGDVIALVMKLEQQTSLKLSAEKDENGLYIPSTIQLSFDSEEINTALAQYMNFKNKELTIDNSNIVDTQSYLLQLDSLQIEIENSKRK